MQAALQNTHGPENLSLVPARGHQGEEVTTLGFERQEVQSTTQAFGAEI